MKWVFCLFADAKVLDLTAEELRLLAKIAEPDWSNIEPAVFGTLFEKSLDLDKRSQLGAHYTSQEDIVSIVEPVLMAPTRWFSHPSPCQYPQWPRPSVTRRGVPQVACQRARDAARRGEAS